MVMKQFEWVEFYKEFAQKLLPYKNNRQELIKKVKRVFAGIGMKLPTLEEKGSDVIDIDPFTVFGTFNKSIKDENRRLIATGYANEFGINSKIPENFLSIPVLLPLNATFYCFKNERALNDIDNLWDFFESALLYKNKQNESNTEKFIKNYDKVIQQKGIGAGNLTMGLYWIDPETFLNLDSKNWWFIFESGRISQDIVDKLPIITRRPSGREYLEFSESVKKYLIGQSTEFKTLLELSAEAWRYADEENQINERKKKFEKEIQIKQIKETEVHYWIYAPGENAYKWEEFYNSGIMAIGWEEVGDLNKFATKEKLKQELKEKKGKSFSYRNVGHALWQFAKEMKPGDVIFVKKGSRLLVGRGVVESDYYYDETRTDYNNVRKVKWTHKGEWNHPGQSALKTLTDITQYTSYVEALKKLFEEESELLEGEKVYPKYNQEDFLKDVFISENDFETLSKLLEIKKNIIIQGAPGVGKTYMAKRLAYALLGEKKPNKVSMIQFHQSYSYEDFIMGYRPYENGFKLKNGTFYDFCKNAEIDSENDYFFIIDEINRGNISKIFGELFMLIEGDKRSVQSVDLVYTGEKFSVPSNVYIIGLMNTADRSLAMIDYALRRRFAFFDLKPAFQSKGFLEYKHKLNNQKFNNLIACIESLNFEIERDENLGEGFCIGHSFFCDLNNVDETDLKNIIEFEIIPLLKEYWFDEPAKVNAWINNLRGAII